MSPFRIACTIFLLISVFAFPLFFTVGVGLFSVIWFRNYYEIIPLVFLNDVLYAVPLHHFLNFQYVMTAAAVAVVCLSVYVRRSVMDTVPHRL